MSLSTFPTWLHQQIASLSPQMMLVLFGLALAISVVGFYRLVYFISIGYAFSIVAMAAATAILLRQELTPASALQILLLAFWGLRLGIFLVRRELHPSFQAQFTATNESTASIAWSRKAIIWVGVSFLYVLMFSPSLFSTAAGGAASRPAAVLVQWLGLAIMIAALAMESIADRQKSAFKAHFPKRFCNTGLYRWVRCPNYLGEILFWVGNWVAGLIFYGTLLQWTFSLAGLAGIVLIMLGSTKRLEAQQNERYGDRPEYQTYVRTVPILVPFIPVYSFETLRVYLG